MVIEKKKIQHPFKTLNVKCRATNWFFFSSLSSEKNFSNILLNFDCFLIEHFVIHDGFVALLHLHSRLTLESLKYNAYFISETNYHQNVKKKLFQYF